jgi:phosphoglucomutase
VEHDIVLATDPDSDRIACAVKTETGYRKLSGNEMGCLLLDYILGSYQRRNRMPKAPMAVMSIVSSPMAAKIAEFYGCHMRITPTGFKYIGAAILELKEENRPQDFVMGFEESCGYLKGTYARDKDAVVASMLVCELAAYLKLQGKTIIDALNDMYSEYGYYLASVRSVELSGADAMEKAAKMMADLRASIPETIGGAKVTAVRDYRSSIAKDMVSGKESEILLPKSNVLEFLLGEKGSVIARPSGTEPKVKFYYTAVGETKEAASALLDAMVAQLSV